MNNVEIMNLHRPEYIKDYLFQPSANILRNLLKKEIPNLILYGPSGSGKKSLLYTFLKEKYNILPQTTKSIAKTFKIGSKEIDIPYFYSNYHIELSVSDLANNARVILPQLISTIGSTKNIIHSGCKILVLHHAEYLDSYTQNMLRRFFEIYSHTCRFILMTRRINAIIEPLQSRCLVLRVPAPSNDQINTLIKTSDTHRNLKKIWLEQYVHLPENPIIPYIKCMIQKKYTNPREILYQLLVKNYDFLEITRDIYEIFRQQIKDENKLKQIICILAKYSRRLLSGTRDIMHLEAMIFNLNSIL